jgi:hypothetical protein
MIFVIEDYQCLFPSRLIPLALCSYILAMPATRANAATPADTTDVQHLREEYHSAVVAHDGAHLAKLFAPTSTAWFNVLSDPGYARAQEKTPDAPKVRPGSVEGFVNFVSTSGPKLDQQHGHDDNCPTEPELGEALQ